MAAYDPSNTPHRFSSEAEGWRQTLESVRAAFRPGNDGGATTVSSSTPPLDQVRGASDIDVEWRIGEANSKPLLRLEERGARLLLGLSIFVCGVLLGYLAGAELHDGGGRDRPISGLIVANGDQSSVYPITASDADLPRGIARGELPYDGILRSDASPPRALHIEKENRLPAEKAAQQYKATARRAQVVSSSGSAAGAAHSSTEKQVDQDKPVSRNPEKKGAEKSRNPRAQSNDSSHRTMSSANAVIAKTIKTRERLARCDRADNLFSREKCKWRVCNGRWGEHGCPSFRQQPNYF